jgi:hypothetical protein
MTTCKHADSGCNYPEGECAGVCDSALIKINEDDCLLDVDESAWKRVLKHRGGCRCIFSPPCAACSDPITEQELNSVGYTYGQATRSASHG